MTNHIGVELDEQKIVSIPEEDRCKRCDGSGNELYYMYKKCTDCNGVGVKAEKQIENPLNVSLTCTYVRVGLFFWFFPYIFFSFFLFFLATHIYYTHASFFPRKSQNEKGSLPFRETPRLSTLTTYSD